jgi:hypothetical protein
MPPALVVESWHGRRLAVARALGRIPPLAYDSVDHVDLVTLTEAPSPGANTIAWLVWHAARVQDHHVAEEIATGRPTRPGLLIEYLEAVDRRTRAFVEHLIPKALDRVVN